MVSIHTPNRTALLPLLLTLALALPGCMPKIWNAGDLADWVREQAVKQGCRKESIELEEWYQETDEGNVWHGTCRNTADKPMDFGVDVDPVWTPSQ